MNKICLSSHNWLVYKINNRVLNYSLNLIKEYTIDLGCGISPYKKDILKVAKVYIGVDWENSIHD